MKLQARLLGIDAAVREGMNIREALRKAYDAIASDLIRQNRNEQTLTKTVPERVFEEALRLGWITPPSKSAPERTVVKNGWLGDTTGWLDDVTERLVLRHGSCWDWHEYLRRRTQEPERPHPPTIKVAGEEVLLPWWEGVWLPIFAGRVQFWRARILSGKPPGRAKDKEYPRRAKWLHEKLIERGWTASDLAAHAGVDRRTVAKILKGQSVSPRVLEQIMEGLNALPRFRPVQVTEIPNE